nr:hypothetical protein [Candidatus Acidoferrales bacterium]
MANFASGALDSRLVRTVFMMVGLFYFTYTVAQWVITDNTTYMVLSVVGVLGVFTTMTILKDWRSGLFIFLCWLVLEDMIRKYFGNSLMIFFAKDVIIGITYMSMLLARRRNQILVFKPPFMFWLAVFFWMALVQVFNPHSPTFFFGLLGMKTYFYYVPLMYAGYALLRTEEDLHKVLMLNMWIAIVVAGFGVLQSFGGGSFLTPEGMAPELYDLSHLVREAPQSHLLASRSTSVFVSDGRFGMFLMLLFILAFGTAGYLLLRTKRGRVVVYVAVGIVTLATIMSSSRGTNVYMVIDAIVLGVALFWGAPWRQRQAFRMGKAIRWMATFAGVAILIAVLFFPEEVKARWAFYTETLLPSSSSYELGFRAWEYPILNLEGLAQQPNLMTGNGTGIASLGAQYVTKLTGVRTLGLGSESGYGTLILEFGALGPILWTLWTFSLLFSAWKVVRKLKQTALFPIGFAIFWYAFMLLVPFMFYGLNTYQNYLTCAYLWLIIGILFRLPGLLTEEQARKTAAELQERQQLQSQEEEALELQGAALSHADAGP